MKICPQCQMELPEAAHFCPRCTYEYPKQEFQLANSSSTKRKRIAIITICITVIILLSLGTLLGLLIQKKIQANKKNAIDKYSLTQDEIQSIINEYFRTGNDIPYNPAITFEMRNALTDYESAWTIFGMKPQDVYEDSGFTVYKFGIAELSTEDDEVKNVFIDYSQADETSKAQYGIYGFNGYSTRDEIRAIMGTPDQNYGDSEWYYRFDGIYKTPSLAITFDENGVVTELYYYTLL